MESEGTLGGAALHEGTLDDHDQLLLFLAISVVAGDFVIVHAVSSGGKLNATTSTDESGHEDAVDGAYDLWVPQSTGLLANNGVLTMHRDPRGGLIHAVVYSDRSSDSDVRCRGFGSRCIRNRVDELVRSAGWVITGEAAAPEDAVDTTFSTSTRSIARSGDAADTDGRDDWHITPTRGATFGSPNTDAVYQP